MRKKESSGQSLIFSTHSDVFIAFAEQGSLIATSKILGIRESSVSYHLSEYEKLLRIQLIDRHQKPCKLTEEGELLYKALTEQNRKLSSVLTSLRSEHGIKPILRFGIVESLARNLGTQIIQKMSSEVREISMITGTSELLLEHLGHREIDFAITSKMPENTSFKSVLLYREPSVLIVPKAVNFGQKQPDWEDLRFCGLPFLRYKRHSGGDKITESMLGSLSLNLPNRIEVDDGGVMVELVRRGIGWSLVRPATLVQHPDVCPYLHILPMPKPGLIRNLLLVMRSDDSAPVCNKIQQTAKEFLCQELTAKTVKIAPWLGKEIQKYNP